MTGLERVDETACADAAVADGDGADFTLVGHLSDGGTATGE